MNIWRKESLRQKIYSDLLSQLIRGDIMPGSPLPSCAQLQKKYRAGRETTYESGVELFRKFIELDLPKPWGILSAGNFQAKGAVDECIRHGLTPKKDFFAIGGTGLKESANWSPALSTFGTPYEEIGKAAAETIIEYLTTGANPAPVLVKNK